MQDMRINLRAKNILQRVLSTSDYITTAEIASDLGLSSRTILRELPEAERWLSQRGVKLDRKTGLGLRIELMPQQRQKLLAELLAEREDKLYTPRERQLLLILYLLQSREPVKLYTLTTILHVTESTVSADLDKVEQTLAQFGIALVRRQGVGVYCKGSEVDIRKCLVHLVYENISEQRLYDLLRDHTPSDYRPNQTEELLVQNGMLVLVEQEKVAQLKELVFETLGRIGYHLTDSAVVGLIVHLAFSVERVHSGYPISLEPQLLADLQGCKQYEVALDIAGGVETRLGMRLPPEEIGYIALHIRGSRRSKLSEQELPDLPEDPELVQLAEEMIRVAEEESGHVLSLDNELRRGLMNHLAPVVSRLRTNLEIRNPLLEEIKANFPELMELAASCCKAAERRTGLRFPESEVAYVAMHLGAAIGKSQVSPRRIFRAVVACASGVATSRLLATRVEKAYDNIAVDEVTGALTLDLELLKDKDIDLMISTVEIADCPVPVVVVSPLLLEEDRQRISALLDSLKRRTKLEQLPSKKNRDFKVKMLDLNNYSLAITEILDNFFFINHCTANTVEELIRQVSHLIEGSDAHRQRLAEALIARESLGGTYIEEYKLLLLHCRTRAVNRLYFGIVQVGKKLRGLNRQTDSQDVGPAIVILAPENCSKYLLETISYVNGMLIQEPSLLQLFSSSIREDAFDGLCHILEDFYRQKHEKYLTA